MQAIHPEPGGNMLITRKSLVPDLSPWRELSALPDRLARLLGPEFATFNGEKFTFNPAIDVAENENQMVITAELPGLTREQVDLEISDDVLTIRGEKKETKEEKTDRMHVVERSYGSFERAFSLPRYLDAQNTKAKFENGVLTVTIPKLEQQKGHKVQIAEQ
jgi:HSP20 family protein